jgi:5-methylcytosine-specific restriction protein A
VTWDADRRRRNLAGSGWDRTRARDRILKRDGHRCQIRRPGICTGVATEADHIVPVSVTGPAGDHDGNLQAACHPCHAAKTADESAAALARTGRTRRRPPEAHPGLLR